MNARKKLYTTVAQNCHGNFNLLTAISNCSRQFQIAHGSFNLLTAVSISLTAILICSRQFQFAHGSFNLLTAVSICSRQFQFRSRQFQFAHGQFQFAHGSFNFAYGNFNLLTAVSISLTAISICLRQFQFRSWQFQFRSWWGYSGFQLKFATPVVKFCGRFWSTRCEAVNYICHLANQTANFVLIFVILRVKKVVNSNVAVMLFLKIRPF